MKHSLELKVRESKACQWERQDSIGEFGRSLSRHPLSETYFLLWIHRGLSGHQLVYFRVIAGGVPVNLTPINFTYFGLVAN